MKTTTWRLIRSLSASEKASVKRFLLRHVIQGESDTASLFDALAGMEEYDEKVLRSRHAGARFLKRLPAAKNELTSLVLRAMRAYHHDKTLLHTLTSMIQDVHFLNSRGLFDLSDELLDKAIALATEADEPILRMKLLMLRSNVLKGFQRMDNEAIEALAAELSTAAREATSLTEAEAVCTWVSLAVVADTPIDDARRAQLEQACLDAHDTSARPNLRLTNLHTAVCYTQFRGNRPEEAYHHERAVLDVYRNNPAYARHAPKTHLLSITNLITLSIITNRFDEARTLTDEAAAILDHHRKTWPTRVTVEFEMRIVNNILHRVSASSSFEEIADDIDTLLERIHSYGRLEQTSVGMAGLFNLAIAALAVGRHADVLAIQREMETYPDHLRPDIHRNMKLFLLFTHYELGNLSLVESGARSIRRRHLRLGDLAPDEDILLSTMLRLAARPTPSAQRTMMADAARRIDEVREAHPDRARTDPFGPAFWFRGQAERIGYARAIREWIERNP
jgi:hypothetical protein